MKFTKTDWLITLCLILIIGMMVALFAVAQEYNTNHPAPHTIVLEGRN